MKEIYLVRHGAVDNPDKINYDRLPNFPLSIKGKLQAEISARIIKNIIGDAKTIIISSPFLRTLQTSEIFQDHLKSELIIDVLLAERREPDYIGQAHEGELLKPQIKQLPILAEEESYIFLKKRVFNLLQKYKNLELPVIIVTHQDMAWSMLMELLDLPEENVVKVLPMETASVYYLKREKDSWESKLLCSPSLVFPNS